MMANLPPPRPKRKADHPLQQKISDSVVPIQTSKVCSSASSCLLPACSPWDDRSMHPMLINYSSADAIYTPDYYPVLPEVKGDTGFTGVGTLNYQNNSWTGSSSRPWQTYEVPKLADSHASYPGDTGLAGVGTLNYQNNGWTGNSSRPWQTYDVPKLADSHASYPVIPNFTEVYNFIASMFDPFAKCPLGHFLRRLKEMDPITAKTVLLLVKNLTINMSSPHFEPLGTWLSTYDGNANRRVAFHAHQIHSMPSQGFCLLPPPS